MTLAKIPTKIHELFIEHGLVIKVEKGCQLFQEGERAEDIFLIQSGIIQLSKETENGKELTLRICSTNGMIGEGSPFCNLHYHVATAKALEHTTLLALQYRSFELLLTEHPALMLDYLNWLQIENMKNQSRLRDLMLHGKKGALFSTLIRLANTYGEMREDGAIFINFALTNTEIANLCATSREMINRMLNDLKKHNIISFDKSYITILDFHYLKDEINCENCPISICRID
ncbi:Crp/Fnr family transcriptional regulator [Solibacillus sp. CAU 1738]|uniref:Crp/Fnr family transcriptional regulator n=1 Tax=Solibacillus sp. CAU 1738 TaxID=3140363 RepID=UPI003261B444